MAEEPREAGSQRTKRLAIVAKLVSAVSVSLTSKTLEVRISPPLHFDGKQNRAVGSALQELRRNAHADKDVQL